VVKTAAPPSDSPPISFGVWISQKPRAYSASRKSWQTAERTRSTDAAGAARRSIHRWSRRCSGGTRLQGRSVASEATISASGRIASSSWNGSCGSEREMASTRSIASSAPLIDVESTLAASSVPCTSTMDSGARPASHLRNALDGSGFSLSLK
jgi:hypothetical protein